MGTDIKTKKKTFYECKHFECECDLLGYKYLRCHSPKSGSYECMCSDVMEMNACPFFNRGDRKAVMAVTPEDERRVDEFKNRLAEEEKRKEACERAMYERLKKKYETDR